MFLLEFRSQGQDLFEWIHCAFLGCADDRNNSIHGLLILNASQEEAFEMLDIQPSIEVNFHIDRVFGPDSGDSLSEGKDTVSTVGN
jgi:hypothetical protein